MLLKEDGVGCQKTTGHSWIGRGGKTATGDGCRTRHDAQNTTWDGGHTSAAPSWSVADRDLYQGWEHREEHIVGDRASMIRRHIPCPRRTRPLYMSVSIYDTDHHCEEIDGPQRAGTSTRLWRMRTAPVERCASSVQREDKCVSELLFMIVSLLSGFQFSIYDRIMIIFEPRLSDAE